MNSCCETPDIIRRAFQLHERVTGWTERARRFFYDVLLADHRCPECDGRVDMLSEGVCSCRACGRRFDPTTEFQHCHECGGGLKLRVRRYVCSQCGKDASSRYLFDGLAFDPAYFREKMAEHRRRKKEFSERVRQMLADSRSPHVAVQAADLHSFPGLLEALNSLASFEHVKLAPPLLETFDLQRYQAHVLAHISAPPLSLHDIPSLNENPRKDLVWRFIAIIFLAHAGHVNLRQEGTTIMVNKRETYTERQGIPGDIEEACGIA